MSWLSSFLHPERGYQKGQEQLDKYYQLAQQQFQPLAQQGQEAYVGLSDAMKQLLHPDELQNQWAQGYQESPYAKQLEGMATEHGLNAASSMGLMGSTPALQALQAGTSQISNQDRQQYLNDLMQKYMAGTGIGQNIYGTGANAMGQMGQNAMNMGQNAAQMAYGQQNAPGNMLGSLLGTGAGLFGSYLAGPMGRGMGWSTQTGANPQSTAASPYQNPWATQGGQ
jgi:hypothetical protein